MLHMIDVKMSAEYGTASDASSWRRAVVFGPTLSVVGGAVATLFVVAIVRATWPQLARLGPLHVLAPADALNQP